MGVSNKSSVFLVGDLHLYRETCTERYFVEVDNTRIYLPELNRNDLVEIGKLCLSYESDKLITVTEFGKF